MSVRPKYVDEIAGSIAWATKIEIWPIELHAASPKPESHRDDVTAADTSQGGKTQSMSSVVERQLGLELIFEIYRQHLQPFAGQRTVS